MNVIHSFIFKSSLIMLRLINVSRSWHDSYSFFYRLFVCLFVCFTIAIFSVFFRNKEGQKMIKREREIAADLSPKGRKFL